IFIYFNDYLLRRLYDSPHIGHLRSQVEISVLVHGSYLEHGNIDIIIVIYPQERQLAEHHRDIPAAAFFVHHPVVSAEMGGRKSYLVVALCSKKSLKRLFSDSHGTYDRNIFQLISPGRYSPVNI